MGWKLPSNASGVDYTGQKSGLVWSSSATVQTTDATETSLLDIALPMAKEVTYKAYVIAESDTAAGEGASYHLSGGAHNVAGTAQLNGTGTVDAYEHSSVTGMACVADVNSSNLRIRVTGEGAHTVNWRLFIELYGHAA